jgi:hypothetical protein
VAAGTQRRRDLAVNNDIGYCSLFLAGPECE